METLKKHLVRIVRNEPAVSWPLTDSLAWIDQYVTEQGAGLDKHFQHYLQNRSYVKALAWIEEHEAHG